MASSYSAAPLSSQPRRLPKLLVDAKARVFDSLKFLDLSTLARRTLSGLLTFLNIRKLDQPLWPEREVLRKECHLGSVETLSRGIRELSDRGYLVREQWRRRDAARHGQFAYSKTWLTNRCLLELDLICPAPQIDPSQDQLDAIEAWEAIQAAVPVTDLILDAEEGAGDDEKHLDSPPYPDEPFEALAAPESRFATEVRDDSDAHSLEKIYPQAPSVNLTLGIHESERPTKPQLIREQPRTASARSTGRSSGDFSEKLQNQIDPSSRLPVELTALFDYGLNKPTIAYLMRLAREADKTGALGSIWKLAKSRIDALKLQGRSVFKYLRAMINKPTDFARVASNKAQTEAIKRAQSEAARHVEIKCDELEGQLFRGEGGTMIQVEANGLLRVHRPGDVVRYGRMNAEFLEALAAGHLRRIVAA